MAARSSSPDPPSAAPPPPPPDAPAAASSGSCWRAYACLLAARVCLGVLPLSYLHPDEYAQNQEVTAQDVFGCSADGDGRAWEFQPAFPVRSVIFPYATSALPYAALRELAGFSGGGWLALAAPRLVMLALSALTDAAIVRVCARLRVPHTAPLLAHASAWPVLVMAARPLSNSAEAFLLAACVWALVDVRPEQTTDVSAGRRNFLLGLAMSAAVFVRFTFVAFVPSLVVYLLLDCDRLCHVQVLRDLKARRAASGRLPSEERMFGFARAGAWRRLPEIPRSIRLVRLARTCSELLLGVMVAFLGAVIADSVYYGRLSVTVDGHAASAAQILSPLHWARLSFRGDTSIAPLNALLYNSDPENLARHGTHPRWLHAAVNLPLLLGPLLWHGLRGPLWTLSPSGAVDSVLDLLTGSGAHRVVPLDPLDARRAGVVPRRVVWLLLSLSASYLGALSLAPHQEARFLLPLVMPLCLLLSGALPSRARSPGGGRLAAWALFNAVMVLVMGAMHQGGVTRAALAVRAEGAAAGTGAAGVDAYFFATYPPPRSLVCAPNVRVHDAGPVGLSLLDDVRASARTGARVLVVAPASVSITWPRMERRRLRLLRSFFPHLETEAGPSGATLGEALRSMSLELFEYGGGGAAGGADDRSR